MWISVLHVVVCVAALIHVTSADIIKPKQYCCSDAACSGKCRGYCPYGYATLPTSFCRCPPGLKCCKRNRSPCEKCNVMNKCVGLRVDCAYPVLKKDCRCPRRGEKCCKGPFCYECGGKCIKGSSCVPPFYPLPPGSNCPCPKGKICCKEATCESTCKPSKCVSSNSVCNHLVSDPKCTCPSGKKCCRYTCEAAPCNSLCLRRKCPSYMKPPRVKVACTCPRGYKCCQGKCPLKGHLTTTAARCKQLGGWVVPATQLPNGLVCCKRPTCATNCKAYKAQCVRKATCKYPVRIGSKCDCPPGKVCCKYTCELRGCNGQCIRGPCRKGMKEKPGTCTCPVGFSCCVASCPYTPCITKAKCARHDGVAIPALGCPKGKVCCKGKCRCPYKDCTKLAECTKSGGDPIPSTNCRNGYVCCHFGAPPISTTTRATPTPTPRKDTCELLSGCGGICVKGNRCKSPFKPAPGSCTCPKGSKCCKRTCRCYASGDPHYYQYNGGRRIDFMGKCKYTFTKSKDVHKHHKCYFNVEEKNVGNTRVSYVKLVDVTVEDVTIRYSQPAKKVYIDGIDMTNSKFPITVTTKKGTKVIISYANRRFKVQAVACGMVTSYRNNFLETYIASTIGNEVEGICGPCNGKTGNYLIPRGGKTPVGPIPYCDSWSVLDDSGLQPQKKCINTPVVKGDCVGVWVKKVKNNAHCGYITDKNGPFKACIASGLVNVQQYQGSCEFDVCFYANGKTAAKDVPEAVCENLAAFADACAKQGVGGVWRRRNFCPLKCEANAYYNPKMYPRCEKTCHQRIPPKNCASGKPEEGCTCKRGYFRLGNDCVRPAKCGCDTPDGQHIDNGHSKLAKGCKVKYACTAKGKLVPLAGFPGCDKNAICTVVKGLYTCKCKDGFSGNGYSCKPFCNPKSKRVTGPKSKPSGKDDATSDAKCPAGYVGKSCRCIGGRCDGAYFVSNDICRAVNRYRTVYARAAAVCIEARCVLRRTYVTSRGYVAGPKVSCTGAFKLKSCSVHSPWSHGFPRQMTYTISGNTCRAPAGCKRCRVQAVCMILRDNNVPH